MDVSLQPCFELQGGKSGSAKVDETVGGSALVGEVGSDDAEDADSLDFDDMDSGELTDMENTGVLVYREKFISKERRRKYWGYFVVGMLRGRKVRVSLVSTDAGGYDLLDIVFNGADSVELWRKAYALRTRTGMLPPQVSGTNPQSALLLKIAMCLHHQSNRAVTMLLPGAIS